mmetsp:Transcript_48179/g.54605  ORF Transcript_48179/g.54605 Transcript_48179/m.54605 type:complete len:121 (+) Transcript_48179:216-578(+)
MCGDSLGSSHCSTQASGWFSERWRIPETETPSDENRRVLIPPMNKQEVPKTTRTSREWIIVATAVKGESENSRRTASRRTEEEQHHYSTHTHTISRNVLSKFSRASSSHKKETVTVAFHL